MTKMTIYAAPVLLAVSAPPALAQEVINTPILSSVSNFRDIAGVAASEGGSGLSYTTSNGGVMRTGVFYRSNALSSVSTANETTLDTLGITELIDLRTPAEIASAPEAQNTPTGATYINISVFGSTIPAIPSLTSAASAEQYLESLNEGFVTSASERAQLATVFADLANADGAVIFNCSAGKDRTGWVAAMLQSIAGVSSSDIMANYLATDTYSAASIAATETAIYNAYVGTYGATEAEALAQAYGAILGVQAADLQAGLNQIITSYGSLDNYLKEGLGMSQAEIYVLRAKMVYYALLPGQGSDPGNAANGTAFINALQNSSLSGHYTTFNYYLQSAIDAGTLGGVPAQIGGQVIADTQSYLTRLPLLTNSVIAPYTSGANLQAGQTKIWEANLAGVLSSSSDENVASSTSRSAGLLVGATHRFNAQTSINAGIGYDWGTVKSAGGDAQVNAFLITAGARYGFASLEQGPFVSGGLNLDVVSTHDNRQLGGGIGGAYGNSNGEVYDGHVEVGTIIPSGAVLITPQLGFDLSHAELRGFTEQGNGVPLRFAPMSDTLPSLTASVEFAMPGHQAGAWTISPTATIGYTRLLSSPVIVSHADFQGFGVSQLSAFNSRDLGTLALALNAQRGRLGLDAGVTGIAGSGNGSTGITGRVGVTYRF
jgi:protein-tyrosine phosphatase